MFWRRENLAYQIKASGLRRAHSRWLAAPIPLIVLVGLLK